MNIAAALIAVSLTGQVQFEPAETDITSQLTAVKNANPSGWWSWGVRAYDWNDDGRQDVLVTLHSAQGGVLYQQNANGTFTEADTGLARSKLPSVAAPAIADFDGNGTLDLGGAGASGAAKVLLSGAGGLVETTGTLTPLGSGLKAVDVNGDGKPDAEAWLGDYGTPRLLRQINNYPASANFSYSNTVVPIPAEWPQSVKDQLANLALDTTSANRFSGPRWIGTDLDADGDTDYVVSYFGSYGDAAHRFGKYLINNNGTLEDKTATIGIDAGSVPLLDAIGDIDGDGRKEIITSHKWSGSGLWKMGANGAYTSASTDIADSVKFDSASYPYVARWVDLDYDDDHDLVISSQRLGYLDVFENAGGGTWTKRLRAYHWDAEGWDLADMNGDGKLDIIVGGTGPVSNPGWGQQGNCQVFVFVNTTPNDPGPPPPPPPPPIVVPVVTVEVDPGTTIVVKVNGQPVVTANPGDVVEVEEHTPGE